MARLSVRSRRSGSGQALAEFALVIGMLLMVVVTVLDLVPALDAQARVLNGAAAAVQRAGRFLPAENATALQDRNALCDQISVVVDGILFDSFSANGATQANVPIANGRTGCTARPGGKLVPGADNPAIWVAAVNPKTGVTDESLRLLPSVVVNGQLQPVPIEVCVAYKWQPKMGLFWLFSKGPGQIQSVTDGLFTFGFCGRDVIDPNRSR